MPFNLSTAMLVICLILTAADRCDAQSSIGACHMQVDGGTLFLSKVMRIKMEISNDSHGVAGTCTLDLKTISSGGASVQGRGSVPIRVVKADLRLPPKHGAIDREDVLINYKAKKGFRGADRFTVVFTGRHAENQGSTKVEFTVAVK